MKRVAIIGIDSMDRELVHSYLKSLPFIRNVILRESPKFNLSSVFPPDSDTAWATVYTGLNPAKHGVVHFVDPLGKATIHQTRIDYASYLRGNTFWDVVSNHGRKVCLLFPHAVYPAWPVNGIVVAPIPNTSELQVLPKHYELPVSIEELGTPKRIPDSEREYDQYLSKFRKAVKAEFELGKRLAYEYEWDLFLFYSSALDFVQHVFWSYCDVTDPSFPGVGNRFVTTIRDFYVLYDEMLGQLVKCIGKDAVIIILSDHGHSMRPMKLFNINELLRREGFLFLKEDGLASYRRLKEKLTRMAIQIIQQLGMRRTGMQVLRNLPGLTGPLVKPSRIDFSRTLAHCTDLSGVKSYEYGGINITNRVPKSSDVYTRIRTDVSRIVRDFKNPEDGRPVVQWICNREELYEGPFLYKYPDLLFQMREGFGAGWSVGDDVFGTSPMHSLYPGSHKGETPVFFVLNAEPFRVLRQEITLMDIAPTVLSSMGVEHDWRRYDGRSALAKSQ